MRVFGQHQVSNLFLRLGLLLAGVNGTVFAQSISITSPTSGATISGTSYRLAVSSVPSATYSVTYYFTASNGGTVIQDSTHTAGISRVAPYTVNWNTNYAWNSPYLTLQAVARDALNNVLATSAAVTVTVGNAFPVPPSVFSWTVTAPASPWSGSKSVSASASGTDASYAAAPYFSYVDGYNVNTFTGVINYCPAGATNPQAFNTAKFENGNHIVRVTARDCNTSTYGQLADNQLVAEWEQVINFSNSSTAMALWMSPGYEVFLCTTAQPGCPTSITFSGKVVNTDINTAPADYVAAVFPSLSSVSISTTPNYPTAPVVTSGSCSSCSSITLTQNGVVGSAYVTFTESGGKVSRPVWVHVNTANHTYNFSSVPGAAFNTDYQSTSIFPNAVFAASSGAGQGVTACGGAGGGTNYNDPYYPSAFTYAGDSVASGFNTAEISLPGLTAALPESQSTFTTAITNALCAVSSFITPAGMQWEIQMTSPLAGDNALTLLSNTPGGNGTTPWTQPALAVEMGLVASTLPALAAGFTDEVSANYLQPIQGGSWQSISSSPPGQITSAGCVNGGVCTVTCAAVAQPTFTNALTSGCGINAAHQFVEAGSGNSYLDFSTSSGAPNPYVVTCTSSASNGGCLTFTFPTPAGMPTTTLTAGANPGMTFYWFAANTYPATGTGSNCQGKGGPCPLWALNNAYSQAISQIRSVSGGPKFTQSPIGTSGPISVQNWTGDPQVADFPMIYYPGTGDYGFMPGSVPVFNFTTTSLSGVGSQFRQWYSSFGPNRLAPIDVEEAATTQTYALQGYSATVASVSGNLITFSGTNQLGTTGHGITNIFPLNTRFVLSGNSNSSANGNYYVTDCPTPTTCHVVYATFNFTASVTGTYTATDQNGGTFTINSIHSNSGGSGNATGPQGPPCVVPTKRGLTFTINGTGTTFDSTTMWMVPYPYGYSATGSGGTCGFPAQLGRMAQVPTLSSGTGGTANIILGETYTKGVNWDFRASDTSFRSGFAGFVENVIAGASAGRSYINGVYYDTDGGFYQEFNNTEPLGGGIQSGIHPRYSQYGQGVALWNSIGMGAALTNRLLPCLFQPRGSAPDYGQFFESTVRLSSTCNLLMVQSLADNTIQRTISLTYLDSTGTTQPLAPSGQTIVKYCAGWAAIAVSTITSTGTSTVDSANSFDPDSCAVTAYVYSTSPWYSPPTISARLADVPNAASIAIQWTYSPLQFGVRPVNNQALYQTYNLGTGTGTPPIDRQIGTAYYRLLYLGANSAVLATSDVQTF